MWWYIKKLKKKCFAYAFTFILLANINCGKQRNAILSVRQRCKVQRWQQQLLPSYKWQQQQQHATQSVRDSSSQQCGKPPETATGTGRAAVVGLSQGKLMASWRIAPLLLSSPARTLPLYAVKCTTGVHCPCANWSEFIANGCLQQTLSDPTAAPSNPSHSCIPAQWDALLSRLAGSCSRRLAVAIKLHFEAAQSLLKISICC